MPETKNTHSNAGTDDAIDWRTVRARLLKAMRASEAGRTLSAEHTREKLAERARILARPHALANEDKDSLDLVVFSLHPELCAIESRFVRSVSRLANVTRLPGTPDFFCGLILVRGKIQPLFDLRTLLKTSTGDRSPSPHVLSLGSGQTAFCIRADEVRETLRLPPSEIMSPDTAGNTSRSTVLIRGVTADAMLIIDGDALLRDPRLYLGESPTPLHGEASEERS